jgi:hypothetical protein
MTWKGNHPQIYLIEEHYEKGVRVNSSELEDFQPFWQFSQHLPQWDVLILPP